MAKEFFQEFGEAFTKTMRDIGGRAESFYSEQKLRNKISGEEKQIRKIMEELGKIIYRRYKDNVPLEDMQRRLCEQIDQRMERISQYKEEIAGVKSRKICPSCGAAVDVEMAFCPHCGAACTVKEKEEQAGEVVAEVVAEEPETVPEEKLTEEPETVPEEVLTEEPETVPEQDNGSGSAENQKTE